MLKPPKLTGFSAAASSAGRQMLFVPARLRETRKGLVFSGQSARSGKLPRPNGLCRVISFPQPIFFAAPLSEKTQKPCLTLLARDGLQAESGLEPEEKVMGLSRTCSAAPSFRLPACHYPETGKAQGRSSAGQGRRRRYCAYDRPVFFRVRDSDPRPAPA